MSGGSKQQTSSNTQNYDMRQVNTFDTTNYDLSNRSTQNYTSSNTTNTTTNADFSDRSTTMSWSDSSNRSTNTTNADFSNRSVTDNSDRSTTSVWSDSSNRSTTTTNADFSNRSVANTSNWTDNSDRSTTTVYNSTTDGGAVAGALGVASSAVQSVHDSLSNVLGFASKVADGQNASTAHAYDYADNIFHGALDAVQSNDTRAMDAYSRAATIENDALAMTRDGFSTAVGLVQNAYADAKGTTQAQQKIMMGVLLVAAVAVIAQRLGK
jgi:hypothetical protein